MIMLLGADLNRLLGNFLQKGHFHFPNFFLRHVGNQSPEFVEHVTLPFPFLVEWRAGLDDELQGGGGSSDGRVVSRRVAPRRTCGDVGPAGYEVLDVGRVLAYVIEFFVSTLKSETKVSSTDHLHRRLQRSAAASLQAGSSRSRPTLRCR